MQQTIFGIAAKPTSELAISLTKQLLGWLMARGIQTAIDCECAGRLDLIDYAGVQVVERAKLTSLCDPIAVLGGDGTLISVCRHPASNPARSTKVPRVIGVNLGTLGFLTEIRPEELYGVVESVLAGEALTDRRSLLQCEKHTEPGVRLYAFNDIVLTKDALARIVTIDVFVDDQFAAALRGDGVIVSSPSGSTAYSLSAGGSIVHPQVSALLVTPICPHSLTSRPLVLPASSSVMLRNIDSDGDVFMTMDGQVGRPLKSGDEIVISTSAFEIEFVKPPRLSYFEALATKLKWGSG